MDISRYFNNFLKVWFRVFLCLLWSKVFFGMGNQKYKKGTHNDNLVNSFRNSRCTWLSFEKPRKFDIFFTHSNLEQFGHLAFLPIINKITLREYVEQITSTSSFLFCIFHNIFVLFALHFSGNAHIQLNGFLRRGRFRGEYFDWNFLKNFITFHQHSFKCFQIGGIFERCVQILYIFLYENPQSS